jgi:hypothetical protein
VFLDLALAAATPVLVTGDADLLALQETVRALQILTPADFHSWLSSETRRSASRPDQSVRTISRNEPLSRFRQRQLDLHSSSRPAAL